MDNGDLLGKVSELTKQYHESQRQLQQLKLHARSQGTSYSPFPETANQHSHAEDEHHKDGIMPEEDGLSSSGFTVATHNTELHAAFQEEVVSARAAADAAVLEAERWRQEAERARAELLDSQQHADLSQKAVLKLQDKLARCKHELSAAQVKATSDNQLLAESRSRADQLQLDLREAHSKLLAVSRSMEAQGPMSRDPELFAVRALNEQLERQLSSGEKMLREQREIWEHEVKTWRLAANQAASVAEKANQQVQTLEAKLSTAAAAAKRRGEELEQQTVEMSNLRRQADKCSSMLRTRETYQVQLEENMILPLLRWYRGQEAALATRGKYSSPMAARSSNGGPNIEVSEATAAAELLLGKVAALERNLVDKKQELEESQKQSRQMANQRQKQEQQHLHDLERLQGRMGEEIQQLEHQLQDSDKMLKESGKRLSELQTERAQLMVEMKEKEHQLKEVVESQSDLIHRIQDCEAHVKEMEERVIEREKAGYQRATDEASEKLQGASAVIQDLQQQLERTRKEAVRSAVRAEAAENQLHEVKEQYQQLRELLDTERQFAESTLQELHQEFHDNLMYNRKGKGNDVQLLQLKHRYQEQLQRCRAEASRQLRQAEALCEGGVMTVKEVQQRYEEQLQATASQHAAELQRYQQQWTDDKQQIIQAHLEVQAGLECRLRQDLKTIGELKMEREEIEGKLEYLSSRNKDLLLQVEDLQSELERRPPMGSPSLSLRIAAAEQKALAAEQRVDEMRQQMDEHRDVSAKQQALIRTLQLQLRSVQESPTHPHTTTAASSSSKMKPKRRVGLGDSLSGKDPTPSEKRMQRMAAELESCHATIANLEQEVELISRALDEQKRAASASEAAAQEALHSAAAATALAEEHAAASTRLQQQLGATESFYKDEMKVMEERAKNQVETAQAWARAELQTAQARLQLVRQKQQTVLSWIGSVQDEDAQ